MKTANHHHGRHSTEMAITGRELDAEAKEATTQFSRPDSEHVEDRLADTRLAVNPVGDSFQNPLALYLK